MDARGLIASGPALRIGLTGGIGSGKSTVGQRLASLGAAIVDTDLIARQLTQPGGAALAEIRQAFGAGLIAGDGALDRARMRELVFADAAAKRRLEAILHPLIGIETERQAEAARGAPAIVFDVPLLVESGSRWRDKVDRVLVVDCLEATQIGRVTQRAGWTAQAAQAVIESQASRVQRRACADAVIFNDGIDLTALADEVAHIWRQWVRTGV